jgi:uracil-DNA glycosylase family 4
MTDQVFDKACRACPRLAAFLDDVNGRYPDYYCKPVPPFGDSSASFLIVGLAPGMHGANRTGRPFTGDHAGILLYQMLHKYGFSTHEESLAVDDDLQLTNCRITNAVKCLPPDNKPIGAEINTCNSYLANELQTLAESSLVLALGGIAHRAIIKALSLRRFLSLQPLQHEHETPDQRHV